MRNLEDYLNEVPEKLIHCFFEQTKNLNGTIAIILTNANQTFLEKFAYSLEDNPRNNIFSYSVLPARKDDDFNSLRDHVEKVRQSDGKYMPIVINFDPYKYGRNIPNGFYIIDVLGLLKIYHIPC